jgi:hypothetical protein
MGKLAQRLSDAARSGVYRTRHSTEVEDAVRGTRLDLARANLGGAEDKEALLERFALALGFPAWFGGNWDALEDCLGDLGWRAGEGHVLLLTGYENLPADDLGVPTRSGILFLLSRASASTAARQAAWNAGLSTRSSGG